MADDLAKRLFCKPANEAEYIAECGRICRKMTGRSISSYPWDFSIQYRAGVPAKDAVAEMIGHLE